MTGSVSARGLPPGTKMGRYELIQLLAMGGMAELYVARQSGPQGFERTVAIKRILPNLTGEPELVRMLLDEARIAASLDHPNIAPVTDVDTEDGEYFLAMEFVHGKNVREILRQLPAGLSLDLALFVVMSVAAALHHAHEALGSDGRPLGLVHRDVSPSNVMVAYSGAVKLTDFGIAKASAHTSKTVAGSIKGKVGYMSPEQCRGEALDRRTDIFALGILLYEVTTGARAFHAPNEFAAMARIARCDYADPRDLDPTYPGDLVAIIAGALQKAPEDRYSTAEAMLADLRAFAEREGLLASSTDLAAFMRDNFGNPAHPQTLSVASVPRQQEPPARTKGLPIPWVAFGIVGAFASGLAIAAAATLPREDASDSVETTQDPPPPAPASHPSDPNPSEPSGQPPSADALEPAPGSPGSEAADPDPPVAEEIVVIEQPAGDDSTDKPNPKRTRRNKSKAKPKRDDKKKGTDIGPSPYPPGWDG